MERTSGANAGLWKALHRDMVSVLEKERDKYRRMWALPIYRLNSPGERAVPMFLTHVPWQEGDTVIDLGCGTGRAGVELAQNGLRVTLLDLCMEALDPGVLLRIPFIEASLWDIPRWIGAFDWIYCVDVLEHIPPEIIGTVLDQMAVLTKSGGFLQIACFRDGCGRMIGEDLHLTLNSPDWWRKKIAERWEITQDLTTQQAIAEKYAIFVVGEPHAKRNKPA